MNPKPVHIVLRVQDTSRLMQQFWMIRNSKKGHQYFSKNVFSANNVPACYIKEYKGWKYSSFKNHLEIQQNQNCSSAARVTPISHLFVTDLS